MTKFIGAFLAAHNGPDHGNPCTVGLSSSSASPPNSPISDHGGSRLLLPLRPIHLARSRCHSGNGETSEVLYTRLKRSCSLNSAASGSNMEAGGASETTETIASVASITEDNEEGVYPHNHFSQDELLDDGAARNSSQIGGTVDQQDEEGRIMVNLEAIEVVSNLDEVSLCNFPLLYLSPLERVIWILFFFVLLYWEQSLFPVYCVWRPFKGCWSFSLEDSIVSKAIWNSNSCQKPLVLFFFRKWPIFMIQQRRKKCAMDAINNHPYCCFLHAKEHFWHFLFICVNE